MISAIVTIGDELLIGQVIDTNSSWIAQQLNFIGIKVEERVSVADDVAAIRSTLDRLLQKVDYIFITGGLGPTKDISPMITCQNCGISSKRLFLKKRPTGVMR